MMLNHDNYNIKSGKMFTYKNPLLYIAAVIALVVYWYVFYQMEDTVVPGLLHRSKFAKLFFICFATTILSLSINDRYVLEKPKKIIYRVAIIMCTFVVWVFVVIPAWSYETYDNEKLVSYTRITPFIKGIESVLNQPLYYKDIKGLRHISDDSGSTLRFYLKNGTKRELAIGSIPNSELKLFYQTIYKQCDWLRDDISRNFANFLPANNNSINKEQQRQIFKYALGDIFFPIFIWLTIIGFINFIKYIFFK